MAKAKPETKETNEDVAQPIRRRYGEEEGVAPKAPQRHELDEEPTREMDRGGRLVNPHDEYRERFANS